MIASCMYGLHVTDGDKLYNNNNAGIVLMRDALYNELGYSVHGSASVSLLTLGLLGTRICLCLYVNPWVT